MKRILVPALALALVSGAGISAFPSAVLAEAVSDEAVSEEMFSRMLAPVETAAREHGATGIAVLGPANPPAEEARFYSAAGDHFLARGFDSWVLQSGQAVPAGALLLELGLSVAEIDYPGQTRQFFGVGRARVLRRVSLGTSIRLSDPETGQLVYHQDPLQEKRDWMSFDDAWAGSELRPGWMGAKALPEVEERNPWWQRALIGGVVAGVAVVYFDGTN